MTCLIFIGALHIFGISGALILSYINGYNRGFEAGWTKQIVDKYTFDVVLEKL
jgi:hypothetical protein